MAGALAALTILTLGGMGLAGIVGAQRQYAEWCLSLTPDRAYNARPRHRCQTKGYAVQ